MKKANPLVVIILTVLILIIPFLVNVLVSIPSLITHDTGNSWIGFWGSYLGGLVTVIGVYITIKYSINQYLQSRHDSIRPYLTVKQLYKTKFKDDVSHYKPYDFHLGLSGNPVNESGDTIVIKEFENYGEIINIGLGSALNLSIVDAKINDCQIGYASSYHSLGCEDKVLYQFYLFDLKISKSHLPDEFLQGYDDFISRKSNEIPELHFSFNIVYQDMYERYYSQKVKYRIQMLEDYKPNIIGAIVYKQEILSDAEIKRVKKVTNE